MYRRKIKGRARTFRKPAGLQRFNGAPANSFVAEIDSDMHARICQFGSQENLPSGVVGFDIGPVEQGRLDVVAYVDPHIQPGFKRRG